MISRSARQRESEKLSVGICGRGLYFVGIIQHSRQGRLVEILGDNSLAHFFFGLADLRDGLRVEQVANLDAVVQVRPVNGETAGLE